MQRSAHVPIWGKAAPNEEVKVTLDDLSAQTRADASGKWLVMLDLAQKGEGPFTLSIAASNTLTFTDVMVGEVWICSGQSNMEMPLTNTADAKTEIANSANHRLRHFTVKKKSSPTPLDSLEGSWEIAGPETSSHFTAAGYYYGKILQHELNAPVGLINATWGGSPVEAWTSEQSLDQNPSLKEAKDRIAAEAATYPQKLQAYQKLYDEWAKAFSRQDNPTLSPVDDVGPFAGNEGWKKITLPGSFSAAGLPDAGAVWIRRKIEVPAFAAGVNVNVPFGFISDFDELYLNGRKIGKTPPSEGARGSKRWYRLPGESIRAGENTIALRIFTPTHKAGITGQNADFGDSIFKLAVEWEAKVDFELPPLDEAALAAFPAAVKRPVAIYKRPACLFNGMIHPLLPYAMAGVIWYQGEENVGRAFQYREAFPLVIDDWRALWGRGDFPFYYCQIANRQPKSPLPADSAMAELREAQLLTLSRPNTGQAVLIDIGEQDDVHPRNKLEVGERLARIALAQTYGKKETVYSGPVYQSHSVQGSRIFVKFSQTGGGLWAKPLPESYRPRSASPETLPLVRHSPNSELEGFAICDKKHEWKWADAKIENDGIWVWAEGIDKPVAVRYGWADNPTCNLYNKAGLPASPFRTDDFLGITRLERFP